MQYFSVDDRGPPRHAVAMDSFIDVINLWPRPHDLAVDIGLDGPHPGRLVSVWKTRDSIPSRYWHKVAAAAGKRGHDISTSDLSLIAERKVAGYQ